MPSGFFGRLTRKWWLMLVLGIIIGVAAGMPVGGKLMPGNLAGTVIPQTMTVLSGRNFSIVAGASTPPWTLSQSYNKNAFDFLGENPTGTFNFFAKGANGSGGWILFGNGTDGKAYGVKIGY